MNAFLWTMVALMALSSVGKLMHLVKESGARETPRGCDAFDVILSAGLIAWAVALLV